VPNTPNSHPFGRFLAAVLVVVLLLASASGITYYFGTLANNSSSAVALARESQVASQRHTQTLAKIDGVLKDDKKLLQFVVSIQKGAPASRQELVYFYQQLNSIAATVGAPVVSIPPSLDS
jgi:Tfp pilus assembly protein PilN